MEITVGHDLLYFTKYPPTTKIIRLPDPRPSPSFPDAPILHPISDRPDVAHGKMKIMLLLILISLLVAAGFLLAYLRAVRDGQFDDDYTPAIRILFDNTTPNPIPEGTGEEKKQQDEDLPPAL